MGFADATKKKATCRHAATGGSSTGGFDDRQRWHSRAGPLTKQAADCVGLDIFSSARSAWCANMAQVIVAQIRACRFPLITPTGDRARRGFALSRCAPKAGGSVRDRLGLTEFGHGFFNLEQPQKSLFYFQNNQTEQQSITISSRAATDGLTKCPRFQF